MKIFFLNIYSAINNRGAESFTLELAKKLSARNEVTFLQAPENSWVVQPKNNIGLLKRFFLDSASLSVLLFSLKTLPKLLKEKPDLLIPMNGFWQVLLCKIVSIFSGSKILITGHSGPGWDEKWNLWLKPNAFVATTGPTKEWARSVCPWTRIEVIPYGLDVNKYFSTRPINIPLEHPIILCPAAAVSYKRIDLTIEVVSKLKKGSLVHLGSGPLINEIKKLGQDKLGKRFISLSVPYQEMPRYYATSDIVTLASSAQENSPMIFLEAMAAGKAVVTTDTKRARWLLGNAGIYINPEHTQEYAKALEKHIDKELIVEQAEKYSWDKILPLYEDLIKTI